MTVTGDSGSAGAKFLEPQSKAMDIDTIYEVYGTTNNLLFKEENILRYCEDGYHPVQLKDMFKQQRYQVYHKLGFGGSATVWLAKDLLEDKWVSLKILTGEHTKNPHELDALHHLQSCGSVVKLLDEFQHHGPNGVHQCLVFELLGPTLDMVISDEHAIGDVEPEMVYKTTMDLLQVADNLHAAGYAHGDISPRNLALEVQRLASLPEASMYKLLGQPKTAKLTRLDGAPLSSSVPSEIVQTTEWQGWPDGDLDSLSDASLNSDDGTLPSLRLIDLGEAFPVNCPPSTLAQTPGLQAAEVIFANQIGYEADLWRIGMIIYYVAFGSMPFAWQGADVLAASMIGFIGGLPKEWQANWSELKQASDNPDLLDQYQTGRTHQGTLTEKLSPIKSDPLLKAVAFVIEGLLRLDPAERISAAKALEIMNSTES